MSPGLRSPGGRRNSNAMASSSRRRSKQPPSTPLNKDVTVVQHHNGDDGSSVLSGSTAPESTSPGRKSSSTVGKERGSKNKSTRKSIGSSNSKKTVLTVYDQSHVDADLVTIAVFVKDVLFEKIKFLSDTESVDEESDVYDFYYENCYDQMIGVRSYASSEEKEMYMKQLWSWAVSKRVIVDNLAIKRSAVYTVMQNRFFYLCRKCHEHGAYMITFECFLSRWILPKAYHLFHDLFFKAAVGDRAWKERLLDEDEDRIRMGNRQTEAFALMVFLKNNYNAWLVQACSMHKFETLYDIVKDRRNANRVGTPPRLQDKKCILDVVYPNLHYVRTEPDEELEAQIEQDDDDDDEEDDDDDDDIEDVGGGIGVVQSPASSTPTTNKVTTPGINFTDFVAPESCGMMVVMPDMDKKLYLKGKAMFYAALSKVCEKISDDDIANYCDKVEEMNSLGKISASKKSKMSNSQSLIGRTAFLLGGLVPPPSTKKNDDVQDTDDHQAPEDEDDCLVHEKKRRRLLKGLKVFTKKGDCRNAQQKGWSNDAHKFREEMYDLIKSQTFHDRVFVKLYRDINKHLEKRAEELANPNSKDRYVPNCSKLSAFDDDD